MQTKQKKKGGKDKTEGRKGWEEHQRGRKGILVIVQTVGGKELQNEKKKKVDRPRMKSEEKERAEGREYRTGKPMVV